MFVIVCLLLLLQGPLGFNCAEDFEIAIEQFKEMVMKLPENSAKRKRLVQNIIDLRMKLQDMKVFIV